MDLTLYPDEDWTVDSTVGPDSDSITFTAPDGSEIRFEASYGVLSELGDRWVKEFGGAANGRNPEIIGTTPPGAPHLERAVLAKIDTKIDNLEKLLTERNGDDDARYPADMVVGDWVRFPPAHSWRQISRIYEDEYVYFQYGGVTHEQRVRSSVRYPYCTAAKFAEVCDR
jgi:hypothetical protein